MPNLSLSNTAFSTNYAREWRVGAALGAHDEAGYIIETVDGLRVLLSPDLDAVHRATRCVWQSPANWQAYRDLADLIVKDHNSAVDRERRNL